MVLNKILFLLGFIFSINAFSMKCSSKDKNTVIRFSFLGKDKLELLTENKKYLLTLSRFNNGRETKLRNIDYEFMGFDKKILFSYRLIDGKKRSKKVVLDAYYYFCDAGVNIFFDELAKRFFVDKS